MQGHLKLRLISARVYLIESEGIRPVILELGTDAGLVGLGEACIAYGVGGTALPACSGTLLNASG